MLATQLSFKSQCIILINRDIITLADNLGVTFELSLALILYTNFLGNTFKICLRSFIPLSTSLFLCY